MLWYDDNMIKFAVFDIDGTLIRWQLYHSVVDRLAKRGFLGEGAYEQIREARMRWKNRESADEFDKYQATLVGVYEKAVIDIPADEFDEIITEVADEYKNQIYTYPLNLAKRLKKEGYFLLAISGSHQEMVGYIARQHGFDDFIGTVFERTESGFSGVASTPVIDKAVALRTLIKKHQLDMADSYAVGDSASDIAMLEMVENPIAFNPNKVLFDVANERGWRVVVERKDVIYELRHEDTQYVLGL